ncbi:MAG TPA: hypothetical protein VG738_12540 [Chitinophagaceae bacterium]|nr:hypothetical protein [Chitinophagaceae bacterium]
MAKEENIHARKRFHKPYRLLTDCRNRPFRCLRKVFQTFPVPDIHEQLKHWLGFALANDHSVYDEGWAREDLMDFCHELLRLAEALYLIQEKHNRKFQHKIGQKLSKKILKELQVINQPVLLTEEEIADPGTVAQHFCNTFSQVYTQAEMQDLLEAVITYGGHKKIYLGNLMLLYESTQCLLCVTYALSKRLPAI